jgi:5'(3')-deoxyribonucleotidase
MITQLFLDMDGVIVDWLQGVRNFFHNEWYPTQWAIPYDLFGCDEKLFWQLLDNTQWWANLPWTEDGKRIWSLVEPFKPCILTHGRVPHSNAGKVEWLHRELPDVVHDGRFLLSGTRKDLVARPGAVLIDDAEHNCEAWEAAGGRAILYPRPWNANKDIPYPLAYLRGMLSWRQHDDTWI